MLFTQGDKVLIVGLEAHPPRPGPRLHKMMRLNVASTTIVFGGIPFKNARLIVYPRQVFFVGVALGHSVLISE